MRNYIICVLFFLCMARSVQASVIFNEIAWMGNTSNANAEWFELYNFGSNSVDISGWAVSGNLSITVARGKSIPPNGYFVFGRQPATGTYSYIPDFTPDQTYAGALSNSGGSLVLKDVQGVLIDSVTYDATIGNNTTKETMQKFAGVWHTKAPTPKTATIAPSNSSSDDEVEEGNSSTTNSTSGTGTATPVSKVPPKPIVEIPKITTKINAKNVAVAGITFPISVTALGYSKEPIVKGKFVWNFGDGMTRTDTEVNKFLYAYQYPGEYVVSVEYYQNPWVSEPIATDRMIMTVISSDVAISSVGTSIDPYVEITNSSSYEMPLSNWVLKGKVHSFVIPIGTVLLPGKRLKLSPRVTLFDSTDIGSVSLDNPSQITVSTYPVSVVPEIKNEKVYSRVSNFVPVVAKIEPVKESTKEDTVIDLNTLGASSGTVDKTFTASVFAWAGLIVIIAFGIGSIFYLGRKKVVPDSTEDELTSDDMKIVE